MPLTYINKPETDDLIKHELVLIYETSYWNLALDQAFVFNIFRINQYNTWTLSDFNIKHPICGMEKPRSRGFKIIKNPQKYFFLQIKITAEKNFKSF